MDIDNKVLRLNLAHAAKQIVCRTINGANKHFVAYFKAL